MVRVFVAGASLEPGRIAVALATAVGVVAVAAGCGDAERSASRDPVSTPGGATAAGLEVIAVSPERVTVGSREPIAVTFTGPVDPASVAVGASLLIARDVDADPGGRFEAARGAVAIDASRTVLTWTPEEPHRDERELRLVLTDGIRAASGEPLAGGAGSAALSFAGALPGAVFEARIAPVPEERAPSLREPAPRTRASAAMTTAAAAGDPVEVSGITPSAGSRPTDPTRITIRFSRGVDPATVVPYGRPGATVTVMQDQDTASGGTHDVIDFDSELADNHRALTLRLREPLANGRGVLVLLTSGVRTSTGGPLRTSATSGTLTASRDHFPDLVFQASFTPRVTAAAAPAPADFIAESIDPGFGARPAAAPAAIRVGFSQAVDLSSLIAYPDAGYSYVVMQDEDGELGGTHDLLAVRPALANGGRQLVLTPQTMPVAGRRVLVILTDRVRSTAGTPLRRGGVSGPLTAFGSFAGEVFESSFDPVGGRAPPAPPAPAVPDPAEFTLESGTDRWHIDFALRAADFRADLERRALLAGVAAVDGPVTRRTQHQILSTCALKFRKSATGGRLPGRSLGISFSPTAPASGTPGRHHSRMAMGGHDPDAVGRALLDPGNRWREDNARPDLGVFSRDIWGRRWLRYRMQASDARYVDGSYRLGDGSGSADARFREIRDMIADWGRAVGTVLAHEVGHSVGLSHHDGSVNVMASTAYPRSTTDPATMFTADHYAILERNLGVQR